MSEISVKYNGSLIQYDEYSDQWFVDDEHYCFRKNSLLEVKKSMDDKDTRRDKEKKDKFVPIKILEKDGYTGEIKHLSIISISDDRRYWTKDESGKRNKQWSDYRPILDNESNMKKLLRLDEIKKESQSIYDSLEIYKPSKEAQ